MKRVIAYTRVSTEEQSVGGLSLEAQRAKCRAYAQLHDLGEVEVISDPGFSGGNMERTGLQELIRGCQQGDVGHVIVTALDRLSRRIRDTLYLVSDVFDGNVVLHSIRESLDTSSAAGRFVLHMFSAVSELERGLTAERISAALSLKKSKGERMGRPPLGFAEGPGELVADPGELAVVQRIFDLRRKQLSLRAIADTLSDEAVPTKRGGKWAPETVAGILRNPKYEGLVTVPKRRKRTEP